MKRAPFSYSLERTILQYRMAGRGRPKKNVSSDNIGAANAGSERSHIDSMFKKLLVEIGDIKRSQEFLSDNCDETLTEVKRISKEQSVMKGELRSVSMRQNKMTSELDELKKRLNKLEQEKIVPGVIIRGIQETENALNTLIQLAASLDVELEADSTRINAQWVRGRRAEESVAHIRAEIGDARKRNELIKKAKQMRASTALLGETEDRPIYVDEITTQHSRSLYSEACKLREYGIKYVWMSNGDVLVREKDGAKVQRVDSTNCIERIKRNIANGKSNNNERESNNNVQSAANVNRKAKKRTQSEYASDSDDASAVRPPKRTNRRGLSVTSPMRTNGQATTTRKENNNNKQLHQYVLTPARRRVNERRCDNTNSA